MPRRCFALTAGFAAVVALAALPGARAQAAPPAACAGMAITDRAGDQVVYPTPFVGLRAQGREGPDNLDLRGVFFLYAAEGGKPSLTANLQVTNLTTAVPEEAATGTVSYFLDFEPNVGDVSFVEAYNRDGEFLFFYGLDNGVYAEYAEGTGRLFPGPDGVIQIDVPLEHAGARPGTVLRGLSAEVFPDTPGSTWVADRAPEEGTRTATVAECPPPPPAAQPNPESGNGKPRRKAARTCTAKAKKIENAKKRKAALKRCRKQRGKARR